jgi:lipopolysaccharide export system permease protein
MAVFIFAIYGNLATAARTWFEHGLTPASLGLWWVHLPFIVLCLWLARKYA